jgi:hypothetical protein
MSLSPRNGQPIKKRRLAPPATGWKCPSCGQKALIRVNKSCRLEDGLVIPKLDRLQCQNCKEDFFDLYAMDQIAEFRKSHPLKRSAIKQLKKAGAA